MIVAVLVLAFVVAQTCQKSSIRFNKYQAIAKAEAAGRLHAEAGAVRFLRQGLTSKPFWIVSLSRPGKRRGTFSELAVVRIDANTGKVKDVQPPQR